MFAVISHYNEDLSWLKELPCDYVVYSKTLIGEKTILQKENLGNEATSYLEYIIQNYNNLNEWTVFLHGHLTSPHQDYSALDIVKKIDTKKIKNKWLNINNYYNVILPERTIAYGAFPGESNNRPYKAIELFFKGLGGQLFGKCPDSIFSYAAAQFLIHKELILSNSKETYIQLNDWLYNDGLKLDQELGVGKSFYSSRLFEWLWYFIFTRQNEEPKIILKEYFYESA